MTIINCSVERHPELAFPITLRNDIDAPLVQRILNVLHRKSIDCYLEHDVLRGKVFYLPVQTYHGPTDDSRYRQPLPGTVFLNDAYNQIGFVYGSVDSRRKVAQFGSGPVEKLERLGRFLWETSSAAYKPRLLRMTLSPTHS